MTADDARLLLCLMFCLSLICCFQTVVVRGELF